MTKRKAVHYLTSCRTSIISIQSRIVTQAPQERNFHIFYILLLGASKDLQSSLQLGNCKDYYYLNQSAYSSMIKSDASRGFEDMVRAMNTLGMGSVIKDIWSSVSGMLQLGNVTFAKRELSNWEGTVVSNTKGMSRRTKTTYLQ